MTRSQPVVPVRIVLALLTALVGPTTGQQRLPALPRDGTATASKYPPAYPREGARKILENDRVILWDVTLENNRRTATHSHPYDILSVTLTPGAIRDIGPDGVIEERRFEAGQVRYQTK